jgi:hypothetical protein
MIIDYLHIDRTGRPFGPSETNTPAVVYADTVLTLPVSLERLEAVARQVQVPQVSRRLKLVEFHFRLALKSGKGPNPPTFGELLRPFVPEADDHRTF